MRPVGRIVAITTTSYGSVSYLGAEETNVRPWHRVVRVRTVASVAC